MKKNTKSPKFEKDVHTEHCCVRHGCKYDNDFACTVKTGKKPQSHLCEHCAEEGIVSLDSLKKVQAGDNPRCPYCSHTLP